jgi:hypothetical protein
VVDFSRITFPYTWRSGIPQWVQQLAVGWTTEKSGFIFQQEEINLLYSFQVSSGSHPAAYPIGVEAEDRQPTQCNPEGTGLTCPISCIMIYGCEIKLN